MKKLILVLSVNFLLLLINCSIFEGPIEVDIIEPEEGDVLVKGENFLVFADINSKHRMGSVDVVLSSLPEDSTYDRILWQFVFDEGVSLQGKFGIEKELTVPSDAPVHDNYLLRVNIGYGGEGSGSGYNAAIAVGVRSSSD